MIESVPLPQPHPARRSILIVANLAWNLVNYRAGLIRALVADGFSVIAVAPHNAEMEQKLGELGCRAFEPIPLDAKGLSPLTELRTFLAIIGIMRKHRPIAVLSWTIKANLWSALAARILGVPSIPNVSGLGGAHDRRLLQMVAAALYRFCFARSPTVFFQNNADRAALIDARLIRKRQAALLPGSGIDPSYFHPATFDRPKSRRFVLVARLLAAKGVREFVEAARCLRSERPELRFALLGFLDVANRDAICREEVEGWVAEGIIEYFPPVDDVRPLLEDCEAMVLPSYYREGLSRALLEAAAMARPVITTDQPGCREAMVDSVTGFLCQPRDVGSLVIAIGRVADLDDTAWRRMGAAGRALVEAEFSETVVIDRYRTALQSATGLFCPEPR